MRGFLWIVVVDRICRCGTTDGKSNAKGQGPAIQLYADFLTAWKSGLLIPRLVQESTVLTPQKTKSESVCCTNRVL